MKCEIINGNYKTEKEINSNEILLVFNEYRNKFELRINDKKIFIDIDKSIRFSLTSKESDSIKISNSIELMLCNILTDKSFLFRSIEYIIDKKLKEK